MASLKRGQAGVTEPEFSVGLICLTITLFIFRIDWLHSAYEQHAVINADGSLSLCAPRLAGNRPAVRVPSQPKSARHRVVEQAL